MLLSMKVVALLTFGMLCFREALSIDELGYQRFANHPIVLARLMPPPDHIGSYRYIRSDGPDPGNCDDPNARRSSQPEIEHRID